MSDGSVMNIAASSCYLDSGEDANYVREQVTRMAEKHPAYYFFDVICKPNQSKEAVEILAKFYECVLELIPDLSLENVFTGITCNEDIRPAMIAAAYFTREADVKMQDVNPERERG